MKRNPRFAKGWKRRSPRSAASGARSGARGDRRAVPRARPAARFPPRPIRRPPTAPRRRQPYRQTPIRQQADKGARHEDFGVGEVDHQEHAVDHGVAEGDQRVEGAEVRPLTSCWRIMARGLGRGTLHWIGWNFPSLTWKSVILWFRVSPFSSSGFSEDPW